MIRETSPCRTSWRWTRVKGCLISWFLGSKFLRMRSEVKSQVMDSVDSKGSLTVKLPKEKTLDMGITFSRSLEQGIELSKTRILQKFLDSIKNKKLKRSKEPPMFQSVQAMREDLYLVTETLKTTKTVILKSEKQYIFWDPMKCFGLRYEHKHQTEVTITPEKVLGYRVKQPVFPNAEIMGIRFSRAEKKNPFQKVSELLGLLFIIPEWARILFLKRG
ncbi:gasdermin-B [Delphinapterus leucas]|uniref:Gasdermin-B n=1 Tax=Delphinapterus leucas TaxID=9749 RepID=A0A7F8KBQ6_DELLE|nr:gasdermin-B [Delphinapterus leucas]